MKTENENKKIKVQIILDISHLDQKSINDMYKIFCGNNGDNPSITTINNN